MVLVVPRYLHVTGQNGHVAKVEIGLKVCLCTFVCWHWRHERGHLHVSALMFGQTYREVIRHCVAFTPGCEKEHNELKISCQYCRGTYGHGVPVDTSQR